MPSPALRKVEAQTSFVPSEVEGRRLSSVGNRPSGTAASPATTASRPRTKEAAETGFFRTANDRYNRERAEVEARYGTWEAAAATPEGRALRRAIFARVAAAEEAFYDRCTAPMQKAAALLALTPAPDLPSLLAKIRVMQDQQLDELEVSGRPLLEVLAEDVGRLLAALPRRPLEA